MKGRPLHVATVVDGTGGLATSMVFGHSYGMRIGVGALMPGAVPPTGPVSAGFCHLRSGKTVIECSVCSFENPGAL